MRRIYLPPLGSPLFASLAHRSKYHPLSTGSGKFQVAPAPAEGESAFVAFMKDFLAGGLAGAVAKTATAPIERVKLLIQTQDANPKILSGEVPRYTGILNCFTRVSAEQGFAAFWRGNTVNVIRYFPTQAFNFAFKDTIKGLFPKYNSKTEFMKFFAANMASGGLAGAGSLSIVYPLDYARTRLASDVGSGNPQFEGLADCLMKTMKQGGIFSMYAGFGVSVVGIVAYRGPYFGVFDTLKAINPWKNDRGIIGLASKFAIAQATAIIAGKQAPAAPSPSSCAKEAAAAQPRCTATIKTHLALFSDRSFCLSLVPQASSRTPSTPSAAASRCRPRSRRSSGCTTARSTARSRSLRTRVWVRCSRGSAPTCSAPLAALLCSSATTRSSA